MMKVIYMFGKNRSTNRGKVALGINRQFAQSDLRATLPADLSMSSRIADSVALRSGCADAHADLELHCTHMSEDPFSHDAAHL